MPRISENLPTHGDSSRALAQTKAMQTIAASVRSGIMVIGIIQERANIRHPLQKLCAIPSGLPCRFWLHLPWRCHRFGQYFYMRPKSWNNRRIELRSTFLWLLTPKDLRFKTSSAAAKVVANSRNTPKVFCADDCCGFPLAICFWTARSNLRRIKHAVASQPEELEDAYWKIRGVFVHERQWERAWLN